jgi:hypothetical protein
MEPFVFVLGCPRSGTSAVGMALQGKAGYGGFHEGHLAPHLFRLSRDASEKITHHRASMGANDKLRDQSGARMMIAAVSDADLLRQFTLLVRRMYADYLSPPWLDKTPGAPMLECLPELAAAFPEAKFIYMHRRLNENLASHGRKFSNISPIEAANHWTHCKFLWDQNKHLVKNRMLEVDQRDVLLHPFRTAERLQSFLDLSNDAAYRMGVEFSYARVERTSGGVAAALDWSELELSEDLSRQIRNNTAAAMDAYGYEYGMRYRKIDPPEIFLARNAPKDAAEISLVGDDVQLRLAPDKAECAARFAFGKLMPGDRLRGVVIVERVGHSKMHLRVRELNAADEVIVDRVFELSGIAAGELDMALAGGENVKLELAIITGNTVPAEFILKMRSLRIERLGGAPLSYEQAAADARTDGIEDEAAE